jgi:hypothetical protein
MMLGIHPPFRQLELPLLPPNGYAFHLRGNDRAPIEEAASPRNTAE